MSENQKSFSYSEALDLFNKDGAHEDRTTLIALYYNFIDAIDLNLKEEGADGASGLSVAHKGNMAYANLHLEDGSDLACDPSIEIDVLDGQEVFLMNFVIGQVEGDEEYTLTLIHAKNDDEEALFIQSPAPEVEKHFSGEVMEKMVRLMSYEDPLYEVKIEVAPQTA